MDKIKRNERLGAMTRILTDTPNRIHTLSEFCEMFGAAKSTISEDIDLVAASFERFDLGRVETVAGAAGGVRYRAIPSREKVWRVLNDLSEKLSEPGRMLPGGFFMDMAARIALWCAACLATAGVLFGIAGRIIAGRLGKHSALAAR